MFPLLIHNLQDFHTSRLQFPPHPPPQAHLPSSCAGIEKRDINHPTLPRRLLIRLRHEPSFPPLLFEELDLDLRAGRGCGGLRIEFLEQRCSAGFDEGVDVVFGDIREIQVEDFVRGRVEGREVAVEEDCVQEALGNVFDVGAVGGEGEVVGGMAALVHFWRDQEVLLMAASGGCYDIALEGVRICLWKE